MDTKERTENVYKFCLLNLPFLILRNNKQLNFLLCLERRHGRYYMSVRSIIHIPYLCKGM